MARTFKLSTIDYKTDVVTRRQMIATLTHSDAQNAPPYQVSRNRAILFFIFLALVLIGGISIFF